MDQTKWHAYLHRVGYQHVDAIGDLHVNRHRIVSAFVHCHSAVERASDEMHRALMAHRHQGED